MSIMVSVMEYDAQREICDSGPRFDAAIIAGGSVAASATTTDGEQLPRSSLTAGKSSADTAKGAMRLPLADGRLEQRTSPEAEADDDDQDGGSSGGHGGGGSTPGVLMSPKSPQSQSSKTGTRTTTTSATNSTVNVAAAVTTTAAATTTTAATSASVLPAAIIGQKEVGDDRKALRDALYQGIFHRHRRTIFAMGSFIRMLKSRNSQYNTIRSAASDGEDETR